MRSMLVALAAAIAVAVTLVTVFRRTPPPSDPQAPLPTAVSPSAEVSAAIANGDLLVRGSMDYVVVPFDWKLVDRDGKEQPIPKEPGTKFHRLPTNQALLATDGSAPDKGEAMTFTSLHQKGPVTAEMLDRYAAAIERDASDAGGSKMVAAKRLFKHEETGDMRGKVFVVRSAPDGRVEIHYLIADRARDVSQLVYVTRKENGDKWRVLLADLE